MIYHPTYAARQASFQSWRDTEERERGAGVQSWRTRARAIQQELLSRYTTLLKLQSPPIRVPSKMILSFLDQERYQFSQHRNYCTLRPAGKDPAGNGRLKDFGHTHSYLKQLADKNTNNAMCHKRADVRTKDLDRFSAQYEGLWTKQFPASEVPPDEDYSSVDAEK